MNKAICGVDPGLSGAVAILYPSGELIVKDMPTYEVAVGGKKRRQIDMHALAALFDLYGHAIGLAVIEDVGAMPRDGAVGAFSFGKSAGAAEMAIVANGVALHTVKPAVWKRYMGLTGDKDMSRRLASRLLPQHAGLWSLKKHDGRAEAALLAVYGSKLA